MRTNLHTRPQLLYPLSVLVLLWLTSSNLYAQTINVVALDRRPVLDGQAGDWASVPGVEVALKSNQPALPLTVDKVLVKAGHYDNQVFFYLQWQDATQDLIHKPYVWDPSQQRYLQGAKREDRLALQFEISGNYDTDWLSGRQFYADMWHWKSSRSNPLGLAHDKSTRISSNKLLRSYRATGRDGAPLYIIRPTDTGQPLYRTQRYRHHEGDEMPKYTLLDTPWGSTADVKARGIWVDGRWQLELARYFDTGQDDDVKFALGQRVRGGIAIFDHSENDQHAISDTLEFQF